MKKWTFVLATLLFWVVVLPVTADGHGQWGQPVAKSVKVGAGFGKKNPTGTQDKHTGVDCSCPKGQQEPILAVKDGRVDLTSWWPTNSKPNGHGNTVFIFHGNGDDNRPIYSVYGHLSAFSVKAGDTVTKGQQIGLCGITGYGSGVHLHFAIARKAPDKVPFTFNNWDNPDSYIGKSPPTSGTPKPGLGRFILPVVAVILVVLIWRRPKQSLEAVGKGVLWVMSPKKNLVTILHEALRGAIEWWLFTIAIIIVSTPQIWQIFKVGFPTWLNGSVQIKGSTMVLLLGALVSNWLLRSASMTVRRRPARRVSLLRLVVLSILVVVVVVIVVWHFNVLGIQDRVSYLTEAWKLLKTRVGELFELLSKLADLPPTVDGAKQALRLLPELWPKIKAIVNIIKDMRYAVFGNGRPNDQGSVSESDAVAVIQKACETESGDWRLMRSLWESETRRGDCESFRTTACPNACCSGVGAKGPFQFMDGTWPTYSEEGWDVWSLYDSTRAAWRMVKALKLPEQKNRSDFARRFAGLDGGQCWNGGDAGYQQGLRVWDAWHCIE